MFSSYQPGYWGAAAGLTIRKSPQKLHRQKQGKRSRRRGLSFLYPLLAIMFVTWVGFLKAASQLGPLQSEQPDAVIQQRSPSGLCDVRLSALLPPAGDAQSGALYTGMRRRLYQAMEASLASQGLRIGGTQSLALGDLFRARGARIEPVLTPLEVPVRAVVVPFLDTNVAAQLHDAVLRHLAPIMPAGGMWVQNHGLYHSTVFHASTHTAPVLATPEDVEDEADVIVGVAQRSCPLRVVLERIVATPSGTVLACWQVAGGTDPAQLRAALRSALPNAPEQQMVTDEAILHTTLARVIREPVPPAAAASERTGRLLQGAAAAAAVSEEGAAAEALQRAVKAMTQELCGTQTTLDRLWFVEEQDRLALALDGRFTRRPMGLRCKAPSPQQPAEQGEPGELGIVGRQPGALGRKAQ